MHFGAGFPAKGIMRGRFAIPVQDPPPGILLAYRGRAMLLCSFQTSPPQDKLSHRAQVPKRPFSDEELKQRGLVKVSS
jgi:hypothetical protein